MSSLVVTQTDNGVEVNGILKHNLRIKPQPATERSSDGHITHEIQEIDHPKGHNEADYMLPLRTQNWNSHNRRNRPRTDLRMYQFEIMIVVDKKYQDHFRGKPPTTLRTYVITLMNSVKLVFSGMERPKINITLVGITTLANDSFHVFHPPGINAFETLHRFIGEREKYLPTRNFDAVVILTSWPLGKILGLAFLGTVCQYNGVTIAQDAPESFNGALTVAHELAHVLGAKHDGDFPPPFIPGHPGATACSARHSYLMGDTSSSNPNQYILSNCTKVQIRHVLRMKPPSCIQRASQIDLLEGSRRFPGFRLSTQEYCERLYPGEGRKAEDNVMGMTHLSRICQVACCTKKKCIIRLLLDRQLCEGRKTCKKGVCGEHAWI